jgi:transcriptional regulator with XRE-family HTH domain
MTLDSYIKANSLTFAGFGDRVGVSHATVSRWVSGSRAPSLAMAQLISRATGGAVGLDDWPRAPAQQGAA